MKKFIENFKKLKSSYILCYLRKIDTIFKKNIVVEGLQHGGKQESVALLVKDLEIHLFDEKSTCY